MCKTLRRILLSFLKGMQNKDPGYLREPVRVRPSPFRGTWTMEIIFTTMIDGKPYSKAFPYGDKEDYETIHREFVIWEMLMQHIKSKETA